jgi:hypothetical protein
MRDTVSEREFLVCLQEQREFEGISAAFKRSNVADFMFLFWLSSNRKRRESRFWVSYSVSSLHLTVSHSLVQSPCVSRQERVN